MNDERVQHVELRLLVERLDKAGARIGVPVDQRQAFVLIRNRADVVIVRSTRSTPGARAAEDDTDKARHLRQPRDDPAQHRLGNTQHFFNTPSRAGIVAK